MWATENFYFIWWSCSSRHYNTPLSAKTMNKRYAGYFSICFQLPLFFLPSSLHSHINCELVKRSNNSASLGGGKNGKRRRKISNWFVNYHNSSSSFFRWFFSLLSCIGQRRRKEGKYNISDGNYCVRYPPCGADEGATGLLLPKIVFCPVVILTNFVKVEWEVAGNRAVQAWLQEGCPPLLVPVRTALVLSADSCHAAEHRLEGGKVRKLNRLIHKSCV
jgi:hypothetical protein